MRWLARIVVVVVANALGLLAANQWVPNVRLEGSWSDIATIALLLAILNFAVKPVLKLVFGPVIVITLGFGLILVNASVLYLLDVLSKNLSIESVSSLIFASLIISFINFVFHLATKT
ncbi:MAG: hypothetical protein A3A43_02445 [Candidatus Liptonbacteria bacterium RIFCSPLOWO2_01_FULL_56_20]|uniref:Phage holin family protein n=1 Tax=Candidatus Liptonbacteria bacterium RIFCSPLOWO2_01_FULL_56_20 TaxID=1798652 RepID=A0A1G2CJJ4_9BACT|nr:MAG: hypothetical protein UY96_C0002G0026 [Parcubacteria group bacterium GW2011_GWB1_56_8]OGY98272.1 MAG: hypothetical protein A2681_00390 [Candidatus Liptonbacteria bacterium RIFCSPHIGHO2_01_FULL_56_18b]OGZ00831.1 MAG: hypothetical protein A3A43_02445 [Candidatus Liptonbacteria bacterium RIFCSPLOWO2_01_FULL_56_20]